jgi:hypothetical protein
VERSCVAGKHWGGRHWCRRFHSDQGKSQVVVFTAIIEFSKYGTMVKFSLLCGLGKFSLYRMDFSEYSNFIYTALCLFFTSETFLSE